MQYALEQEKLSKEIILLFCYPEKDIVIYSRTNVFFLDGSFSRTNPTARVRCDENYKGRTENNIFCFVSPNNMVEQLIY